MEERVAGFEQMFKIVLAGRDVRRLEVGGQWKGALLCEVDHRLRRLVGGLGRADRPMDGDREAGRGDQAEKHHTEPSSSVDPGHADPPFLDEASRGNVCSYASGQEPSSRRREGCQLERVLRAHS